MTTAVASLRNAENNAISRQEPSYTGSSSDDGGFYTGSGRDNSKKKKGGIRGRTAGVIISIALLLGGGAAFLGSSNSLLAPALEALTTSSTQTSYTSYTIRAKNITSGMLNGDGAVVKNGWTGSLKYSKIPKKFRERLAKYDIEVEGTGKNTILKWNGEDIDANKFVDLYNNNVEFRDTYTKAKRGRVATFFDDIAEKIYQKLGISRNLFSSYKQTGDSDADIAAYKDTMKNKFDGNTSDVNTRAQYEVEEPVFDENGHPIYETTYDADGNQHTTQVTTTKTEEIPTKGTSTSNQTAEANIKAEGMIKGVADKVGQVGSWACTAMKVGSMIGAVVAAQETYQSINYFMGLMENVSKMKAGYGDASAINEVLNFLSTSQETTTTSDFGKLKIETIAEGVTPKIDQKTEKGSPLEASGLQVILANAPATSTSTTNYSLERVIKALGGAAAFGATAMGVCAGVDMANSLLSIGTAIATGGASIITNFLFKAGFSVVVSISVSAFLGFLIPTLANTLFSNAFETATGIPAGHLFTKGAAAANMREGRSGSGQSPSGKKEVAAFNHSTQQVLALESEIDRLNRSPFDTSSPNTFFGSIVYSLLPTITSSNISSISALLRSTTSSLSSLLKGNVYADGEDTSYLTTYGECPLLDEIKVAGDLYCNPIVTTDMTTIDLSPDDDKFNEVIAENLEDCSNGDLTSDTTTVSNINGSDITIIGDSITNGARNKLTTKLPGIKIIAQDSKAFSSGSSSNPSGLSIIKGSGFSPTKNVIFALGTNQSNLTQNDINQVINTLGSDHEIYFITNYKSTDSKVYESNNQLFKQAATNSNVHVIDWASRASADLISNDGLGVHPTSAGQDLFVQLIYDAIAKNNTTTVSDPSTSIGNCKIKEKSNLAKYITFCDGRDSPFGMVDQNILGSLQADTFPLNKIPLINSIPGINDVMDLINGVIDINNIEWANGKKCTNTKDNQDFWQSEGKYYQRYVEDQRILEQMGAYEDSKNPVVAYEEAHEEKYLEEHPEANTYIGYLSRISGLTPENTETVLAFVEYYNFVDQYDPTSRIAMDGGTTEIQSGEEVVASIQQDLTNFSNPDRINNPIHTEITTKYIAYVDYADLRNRSHAA